VPGAEGEPGQSSVRPDRLGPCPWLSATPLPSSRPAPDRLCPRSGRRTFRPATPAATGSTTGSTTTGSRVSASGGAELGGRRLTGRSRGVTLAAPSASVGRAAAVSSRRRPRRDLGRSGSPRATGDTRHAHTPSTAPCLSWLPPRAGPPPTGRPTAPAGEGTARGDPEAQPAH